MRLEFKSCKYCGNEMPKAAGQYCSIKCEDMFLGLLKKYDIPLVEEKDKNIKNDTNETK